MAGLGAQRDSAIPCAPTRDPWVPFVEYWELVVRVGAPSSRCRPRLLVCGGNRAAGRKCQPPID